MDCSIRVAKTKALAAKLVYAFVFAYANCWFSHAKAHFSCKIPFCLHLLLFMMHLEIVTCNLGKKKMILPEWSFHMKSTKRASVIFVIIPYDF